MIEPEKKDAGSPLHLADRRALPAAEWVWRARRRFPKSNQEAFAAQFVLGDRAGVDEAVSQLTLAGGSATVDWAEFEIIEHESAFQARLRGWLLGD